MTTGHPDFQSFGPFVMLGPTSPNLVPFSYDFREWTVDAGSNTNQTYSLGLSPWDNGQALTVTSSANPTNSTWDWKSPVFNVIPGTTYVLSTSADLSAISGLAVPHVDINIWDAVTLTLITGIILPKVNGVSSIAFTVPAGTTTAFILYQVGDLNTANAPAGTSVVLGQPQISIGNSFNGYVPNGDIGSTRISNFPAIQPVSGTVDVSNLPVATPGTPPPATATPIAGTDGTNTRELLTDTGGRLELAQSTSKGVSISDSLAPADSGGSGQTAVPAAASTVLWTNGASPVIVRNFNISPEGTPAGLVSVSASSSQSWVVYNPVTGVEYQCVKGGWLILGNGTISIYSASASTYLWGLSWTTL